MSKNLVLSPAQERAQFAEAYPEVRTGLLGEISDDGKIMQGQKPDTSKMSDKQIRQMQELLAAEHRAINQGMRVATIVNMNPYALRVSGVLVGDIVVPPREKGQAYSIFVVKKHRVTWKIGDENTENTPIIWPPIMLAKPFEEEHRANGGVVVYEGNGEKEPLHQRVLRDQELADAIELAKKAQMAYAKEKVREANVLAADVKNGGLRNINDIHRGCAELLHDETGQEYPSWMDKTPGQGGLGFACPRCKAVPNGQAYMCSVCAYILDPREAYEQGDITEADTSLIRLSREVLEEMGISELIEETLDERKERVRKEAARLRGGKDVKKQTAAEKKAELQKQVDAENSGANGGGNATT